MKGRKGQKGRDERGPAPGAKANAVPNKMGPDPMMLLLPNMLPGTRNTRRDGFFQGIFSRGKSIHGKPLHHPPPPNGRDAFQNLDIGRRRG